MSGLAVQNGIAPCHVRAVLHDLSNIFFIADVHEATSGQLIFLQNFKEYFSCRHASRRGNFADQSTRPSPNFRTVNGANLRWSDQSLLALG